MNAKMDQGEFSAKDLSPTCSAALHFQYALDWSCLNSQESLRKNWIITNAFQMMTKTMAIMMMVMMEIMTVIITMMTVIMTIMMTMMTTMIMTV